MKKHFISVLGIGKYEEILYFLRNKEVKTKFIQKALIEIFNFTEKDNITIFLTKGAREKHWMELDELLKNSFPILTIDTKDIPDGANEKEIMEIFDIIYSSINDNEEIIFDITHGFRSIPMLAMTVINYAKTLKNISLAGIYYGAFEAKTTDEKTNLPKAPIFNLTAYDDILNWSTAANSFIKFGNSMEIHELCKKENIKIRKISHNNDSLENIYKVINNLNNLTNNISSGRGKFTFTTNKNSIGAAYNSFKLSLEKLNDENIAVLPEILPLFKKIKENIKDFDSESNLYLGIATIKWCIKHEMIQQGYTALEETIKTYLCDLYNLDNSNIKHREDICKNAMTSIGTALKSRNNSMTEEELRNNSIKYLKKGRDGVLEEKAKETLKEIIATIPIELVKLSSAVNELRNDINHFGFTEVSNSHKNMQNHLKKHFSRFIEIINN
ncbi:TIGR02221 family CRISPR-associated protein [Fusobacterium sp. PH5-44]|uniref:TIGR02221 family CRISPR-associated protein n=1 Tax=unclassified Fusobacterium TaxID=2648384 RepID=UPI003D21221C